MTSIKEAMIDIASGKIEDIDLEIAIDGESCVFRAKEAKAFAIGYLTGLKAGSGVTFKDAREKGDSQ